MVEFISTAAFFVVLAVLFGVTFAVMRPFTSRKVNDPLPPTPDSAGTHTHTTTITAAAVALF